MIRADVVVVGAGVIGLTTAWALVQAGRQPLVLDAGAPAAEASWAGGGIVCPVPPWRYPDPINALVARSRALFPDLIQSLERSSGEDCEYRVSGLLLVGELADQGRDWLARGQPDTSTGVAADFEPELRPPAVPAILLEQIPQVRNPRLARALVGALGRHGVPVRGHAEVTRIRWDGDCVVGIVTAGGEVIKAADVVVATGAWTDQLLAGSGLIGLGIEPVRGQMLLFAPRRPLLRHIVNHGRGYFIPRRDGRILAGSSVERVGFDRRPQRAFYEQTLATARSCLPALSESDVECQWLGFRPAIAGELPAIGAYPGVRGLWLNAGHFRNGLGMAPAAAELLVRQMQGDGAAASFQVRPVQA